MNYLPCPLVEDSEGYMMRSVLNERMLPYAGNMNHWIGSLIIPPFLDLTGE